MVSKVIPCVKALWYFIPVTWGKTVCLLSRWLQIRDKAAIQEFSLFERWETGLEKSWTSAWGCLALNPRLHFIGCGCHIPQLVNLVQWLWRNEERTDIQTHRHGNMWSKARVRWAVRTLTEWHPPLHGLWVSVSLIQCNGRGLLASVGVLCRWAASDCRHLGRGSCLCWFSHTLFNHSLILGSEEDPGSSPNAGERLC